MKFYDCRTAPSPRRVRMFIREKGLDIPVVEVDLRNQAQFDGDFLRKNPRATVPVLELDGGECIYDTLAICDYLESRYPEPPLIGKAPIERAQVLTWYARIVDDGFTAVSESFRNFVKGYRNNALTGQVGYAQIPELVGRQRALRFFEELDQRLTDREFVATDTFSLADIAALVTVDFARAIKLDITEDQVSLHDWHQRVSARPSAQL